MARKCGSGVVFYVAFCGVLFWSMAVGYVQVGEAYRRPKERRLSSRQCLVSVSRAERFLSGKAGQVIGSPPCKDSRPPGSGTAARHDGRTAPKRPRPETSASDEKKSLQVLAADPDATSHSPCGHGFRASVGLLTVLTIPSQPH
ncbi:hypothetical protein LX36DRAFT_659002 [Colletotrichum falcatum]|nr:hypothetical protein LX36DRAFT_659002 [Colletotrichum falcatum]